MPGSSTRTKMRVRESIHYNRFLKLDFDLIPTVPVSQVPATIQAAIMLPVSCKILGAAIYYGTIGLVSGATRFNIVAGVGTYETVAGLYGADIVTFGTPHTGDIVTLFFQIPNALLTANGVPTSYTGMLGNQVNPNTTTLPFAYQVQSTDTTATILAASIATAFNGATSQVIFMTPPNNSVANDIVFAYATGATVSFGALQPGNSAATTALVNSIGITSSVTGTGATTTASVANPTITGATTTTGVTLGINDMFEYTGQYIFAPAGSGTLGATPIFSSDMPLFAPSVGSNVYWSSNFDVIYQQGSIMTLRLTTPGITAGTNFKAKMLIMPVDVAAPNPTYNTFDPHNDVQ
jgi:hypothetical protein